MTDARFEDGGEAPLRLVAQDAEDLKVVAALVQDAVLPVTELKYDAKRRRFALAEPVPLGRPGGGRTGRAGL
jgi:hypothetical protein